MRLLRRVVIVLCVLVALCAVILYPLSYHRRLFVGWQSKQIPVTASDGTVLADYRSVEFFVSNGSVAFETYLRDSFWVSMERLTPPDWWDRNGLYAGAVVAGRVSAHAFGPESRERFGFFYHDYKVPANSSGSLRRHAIVAAPLWLVAIATGAYPMLALVRRRRGARRVKGRCPDCGYDVRATPHRCPECGRNISPASSTVTAS